jgi:ABC-type branched-subunit amino acid transport system permease subunit
MKILPDTKVGKWSVGLQTFFLMGAGISALLLNIPNRLSYNDRWWDITAPIIFSATIAAFILGIRALRKHKDYSALVYISVGVGALAILFIFTHSLFISD